MPKISEDYEGVDGYNMQQAIETRLMEFADLTGSIICSQPQTRWEVERVWKKCKTNRIACIVAGVYEPDFENARSIAHSQMGPVWNPKHRLRVVAGPALV